MKLILLLIKILYRYILNIIYDIYLQILMFEKKISDYFFYKRVKRFLYLMEWLSNRNPNFYYMIPCIVVFMIWFCLFYMGPIIIFILLDYLAQIKLISIESTQQYYDYFLKIRWVNYSYVGIFFHLIGFIGFLTISGRVLQIIVETFLDFNMRLYSYILCLCLKYRKYNIPILPTLYAVRILLIILIIYILYVIIYVW